MASGNIHFRVTDKMKAEMEETALRLGFVTVSGEANVSAYLRAAHLMMKRQFDQGLILPGNPVATVDDGDESQVA